MGVKGLARYIYNHSNSLAYYEVRDQTLIIDANSVFHDLHRGTCDKFNGFSIPCQYGGEYDLFEKVIRNFFQSLRDCLITPYLVFDGGVEKVDKKLSTRLEREDARLQRVQKIHTHGSYSGSESVFPILGYEVFLHVLRDLQIKFVVCEYEADEQIAALANRLECPILSNDTDFFIFDIKAGVMPCRDMDTNVKSHTAPGGNEHKYLQVSIYRWEDFVDQHCLSQDALPLLATLAGNDYVEQDNFEDFFDSCLADRSMTTLLSWMRNQSMQSMLDMILYSSNSPEKREQINKSVNESMNRYSSGHWYIQPCVAEVFGLNISRQDQAPKNHVVRAYGGAPVPDWVCDAIRCGAMSTYLQTIIVAHRLILHCQIEDMDMKSAYEPSAPIRRAMYEILLSCDRPAGDDHCDGPPAKRQRLSLGPPQNSADILSSFVIEYGRFRKQVSFENDEGLYLPSLGAVPSISKKKLIMTFLAILRIPRGFLVAFPPYLKVYACAMLYWRWTAQPTESHVKALIITLIILTLRRAEPWPKKQIDIKMACEDMQRQRGDIILQRFIDEIPDISSVNTSTIHGFSQFQACLLDVMHVQQALNNPLWVPHVSELFSGSIAYRVALALRKHINNHGQFVAAVLQEPQLCEFYSSFLNEVYSLDPKQIKPPRNNKNKKMNMTI